MRWCVRYILWHWWKVCYHGNSISGQENGENFVDWTTSTLFRHLKWNLAHMVAVWCSCAKHTFWQWRKVCCHGNGISCQKLRGKGISNQIWHTCSRWSVAVHDTFWDTGGMCVTMVTAYHSKNWKTKHFTSNSKEIGFTCWPWGVDEQETFLRMGKKCVAMVTTYANNWGGKHFQIKLGTHVRFEV